MPPVELLQHQLTGQFLDGLLGCGSCGNDDAATYEVSQLHEEQGEVSYSSVIGILHHCDVCAGLLLVRDWKGLEERRTEDG